MFNKALLCLSTVAIVSVGASSVHSASLQNLEDNGIIVHENSSTRMLNPIGKLDADTTVYSDTAGLYAPQECSRRNNATNIWR